MIVDITNRFLLLASYLVQKVFGRELPSMCIKNELRWKDGPCREFETDSPSKRQNTLEAF